MRYNSMMKDSLPYVQNKGKGGKKKRLCKKEKKDGREEKYAGDGNRRAGAE
ncbi:MAG: hypothetical protein IKD66_07950 [Solobacterium sp.]|nr:hypothetical protein [Solobacterium sp.]